MSVCCVRVPPPFQVIDDNKLLLKAKYDEAKALGEAVNASKARINELKGHIELWRAQRAAACECRKGVGGAARSFSDVGSQCALHVGPDTHALATGVLFGHRRRKVCTLVTQLPGKPVACCAATH